MSRREIREWIFKFLFQIEFHCADELDTQLGLYMEELEETDERKRAYIDQKIREIWKYLSEIDVMINEKTTGWKTNRMAKVDLALIRLAVYEMKYEADIPTGVAINEAVELAKIV